MDKITLEQELQEQAKWKLRPQFQNWTIFQQLVYNEFIAPEEHRQKQQHKLRNIINFAVKYVPYYGQLFQKLGLAITDIQTIEDLQKIPILSQNLLVENEKQLQTTILPQGEKIIGWTESSGTTGTKKRVLTTHNNNIMFTILAQRNYRFARFNPLGKFARISIPNHVPKRQDGSSTLQKEGSFSPFWTYGGQIFYTGEEIGFGALEPWDLQLEWLHYHQPDYLLAYGGALEVLAFASEGKYNFSSLKGIMSIGEQVTEPMSQNIERLLGAKVSQNYGLNEIGAVAMACEAGRFHVNTEHCLVEIVNEEGNLCKDGQLGQIVITGFNNYAMPLIRYTTGDLGIASSQPCPCGRTLPHFAEIRGRYRRYQYLPKDTLSYFNAIGGALNRMSLELISHLRQYQLHHYQDNTYELRLLTIDELPDEFYQKIQEKWAECNQELNNNYPLKIKRVEKIELSKSGKHDYVTSDYFPDFN